MKGRIMGRVSSAAFAIARILGSVSSWLLKHVFRRQAANFPGKIALYADPNLIAHLRARISEGLLVVVGTNGKTTVTNLIADALERAGKKVACNRTGANLDSGVATALMDAGFADWGVFESDELWLARVLPHLQPDYLVLLNLFRDQLDRAGEIAHVQDCIVRALLASPSTTLVYNADDPFCQSIACCTDNPHIAFGVAESLRLPQDEVADSQLCPICDTTLHYEWCQYGQLGAYRCPTCDFAREEPLYRATDVMMGPEGLSFFIETGSGKEHMDSRLSGAYSVYNLLAVAAAAHCCQTPFACVREAVADFAPSNGRQQVYEIDGKRIMLTLAKNPTGLNQSLHIVLQDPGPKAIGIFINDKEADGHDVSWLWDADFHDVAQCGNLSAFAGGLRRHDLRVRLKYAGIDAPLADNARDFLAKARATCPDAAFSIIANYTALPHVKAELDRLEHLPEASSAESSATGCSPLPAVEPDGRKLVIVHVYPELLNLYGDGGNVAVLEHRARMRGIDAQVVRVSRGQDIDLSNADIVFLGGGPDREQRIASSLLMSASEQMRAYVESDGVLLAICGGYQVIGREWLLGDETVAGLGLLDVTTGRAEGGSHNRLVGNVALDSPLATLPVIGYENHAGRTYLGARCQAFGTVVGGHGNGNNDESGADGAIYRNVLGTYLHGPLLAKNPEIADYLIERALARRAAMEGIRTGTIAPLDDSAEHAANRYMCTRLGLRR